MIIKKPATKGLEDRKTVVLQSHLDMVHQKNNDTDFDFDTQGIEMYVDGDWVRAKGTTLGADNGLGVATIMAILESKEIGHQLGYAKENEANYMACLTTMNHPNEYMRYAGYTFALQYCYGELLKTQPCEAENLLAKINPGVLKDYRDVRLFWESHNNPLEPFFKIFYGNYLKANNQPQGIESYNYVVALLVNMHQKQS